MSHKLGASAAARKCTGERIMPTKPPDQAYDLCMPAQPPSFIAHISKVIGRKAFCYELRISKGLLDGWISGERKDPIERVRDIMRVAARSYGPDLPLDIAQELVAEFGGEVMLKRKPKSEAEPLKV